MDNGHATTYGVQAASNRVRKRKGAFTDSTLAYLLAPLAQNEPAIPRKTCCSGRLLSLQLLVAVLPVLLRRS